MSVLENIETKLPFRPSDYLNTLGELESRGKGDYAAVNKLGYIGRYQMGAKALADIGWVKPGTTNKGLKNANNWLIGDYNSFIKDPSLQDTAAVRMLETNYDRALRTGVVSADMQPHEVAGHLAGMHLVGLKGYKKSLAGEPVMDANKVVPSRYYNYISERLAPVKQEQAQPIQAAPEQPWWANPLQSGKNFLRNVFE